MDKRIIINADDFGLCSGVNEAVAQAHTSGVLTSTTIMANMPAAEAAVKLAKQMPNLGVGVHLNLFAGKPLSKDANINCLLDDTGSFALSSAKLSLLSIASRKIRNAIRTEFAAQIQWVIDNGIKPTHLDSHKHIHCFPSIFPIVCALARQFEIRAIRFIFEPKQLLAMPWPLPSMGGRQRARKARILAKINRFQSSDLLKTDCLLGVAHMGKIDVNFFKAVALYNPAATAEIMTHPGIDDETEKRKSSMHQRKSELDALCSDRTKQYLRNAGVKLIHYGQL
ncbi:MAG: ChbG/HpnK family deacetylase [Sedimentisphaerales bacterium]|nr:ChbG/HpnK family deacetylase [Sedimentisphaerales bacterium]